MSYLKSHITRFIRISVTVCVAIFLLAYAIPLDSDKKIDKGVIKTFIKDTIPVEIDLLYDTDSLPDLYYSYIETPVCEEGICYDLKVHLYWDLLGNFSDYEEVTSDPFTKYEHELFTAEDHHKLRQILADKTSPLANYKPEELVDKSKTLYSPLIDAVVGATYPALKNSVVPGAVYSTHTLWNIVNGSLSTEIKQYTIAHLDEAGITKMAFSKNHDLQMYALRNADKELEGYWDILLQLIVNGEKYVPYFAIAKVDQAMWSDVNFQKSLIEHIETADFELQNEIISGLVSVSIDSSSLSALIKQHPFLKENQYEKFSTVLKNNINGLDKSARQALQKIATDTNNTFAPFAKQLVELR